MEKIGKWALVRIILILVGLLYGTLHHFDKITKGFNEGFTILLLLLVVELSVELLIESRKGQELVGMNSVLPRRSLCGKVYTVIRQELVRALTLEKEGFRVAHKTLALSSYDTFWRFLVEEQKSRNDKNRYPMHLKVIHSCDFEIWVDHPLTKSLLERQKDFIKNNGTIERILCGSGSQPDDKIRKAAKNMREVGVIVSYYNMDKEDGISHDFASDFLHVAEAGPSVVWKSFTNRPHGVISEAIYLNGGEYEGQNLGQLWAEIQEHSDSSLP